MSAATTTASAADLAARPYTKAPPMVAPVYNWSGFYVGANGGYGSSRNCWDITGIGGITIPATREGCHDSTGAVAGGQIGYRWQSAGWVFGLEAQGDWADLSGSSTSAVTVISGNRTKIDAFGLFTGQIGYAWNSTLLYVKGGAAVTSNRYENYLLATNALLASASATRWGATAGVGVEFGFAPNWSVGVEYNHLFMDRETVNFNFPVAPTPITERIRQDADLLTVRVNYRWGGPVVARY